MNNKKTINVLTEGAIYVAIYALIALLSRFLLSIDSLIYYIYPIPIAFFSARHNLKYSLLIFFASLLLSFLFSSNPLIVLMLFFPKLIIGLLLGLLETKINNKVINYFVIFIACVLSSFLSIKISEIILGIGYFDDVTILLNKILPDGFLDSDKLNNIVSLIIVGVILIDGLIQEILLYMLFIIGVTRLKLVKEYQPRSKMVVVYSPFIALISILAYCLLFYSSYNVVISDKIVFNIIYIISIFVSFIISFYLLFLLSIYIRLKLLRKKLYVYIICVILMMILFPISIVYSLVLNLISYKG